MILPSGQLACVAALPLLAIRATLLQPALKLTIAWLITGIHIVFIYGEGVL